jgi:hypothetical protein
MKKIPSRLITALLVLIGCAALTHATTLFGQDFKSLNVFRSSSALPKDLKRVLVLPLAYDESRVDLTSGCEMLDPILQAELVKTKKFEVVPSGSEMLHSLTGRCGWTGAEILPADFFDSLQRAYGCDAVLFCQLTAFRAYVPLTVGWRLKLVDIHSQKIIWSADEAFDAGEPVVARGAKQFQKKQQNISGEVKSLLKTLLKYADRQPPSALEDQWAILNSPRYFSQYSAAKLLQTLPER